MIERDLIRDGDRVWVMDEQGNLDIRPVEIAFRARDQVLVTGGISADENACHLQPAFTGAGDGAEDHGRRRPTLEFRELQPVMKRLRREPWQRGPLAWMTYNRVTPNLLMIALLLGGFLVSGKIKKEVFPDFELDRVSVSVAYPGSSPEEVEQGIVLVVEEAVRGLDGIKEMTSTASEGRGLHQYRAAYRHRPAEDLPGDQAGSRPDSHLP